ncbi:putative lea domain protein [Phaeoacremonium minimum UCRPA7]|uniref:Putative lea domain protein n=1 Tax=Phaeoacremonium minimum (strain UCR-PA7) TaxID=1286976 RepID=R8BWU9_PHAM7|nr:putative lea domain protein [Phaeoacremonium minimum UCRPA7]EOO03833.1 putative lea domain protein [Phaeoacremonium minimum UCRPA7]
MSQEPLSYLLNSLREINVMIPFRPKSAGGGGRQQQPESASRHSRQSSVQHDPPEEDFEVEELPDDYKTEGEAENTPRASVEDERPKTKPGDPAYVSPIPKIPRIPSIHRAPGSPTSRRSVQQIVKDHLVGKRIDEFGDIVDEETGKVLGRVAGDLPSMVGRTVLNQRGDVLGDDGELLGYVAEVETEDEGSQEVPRYQTPRPEQTKSLQDFMKAKGNGGLMVDPFGNILDGNGNVVGSFHDKISGFGKPAQASGSKDRDRTPPAREKEKGKEKDEESEERDLEEETKEEKRPNAQSHRKEDPKESPSDIFLDVKSTIEGIQLTIRIPTVFPGGGQAGPPRVSFVS